MGGVYQNPRNCEADKGRFGFDVTHNAVLNWVYEMPFLKHFRGGVRGFLLSGWQTNGILTMRTGFPFNLAGGNINTGERIEARPLARWAAREQDDAPELVRHDCLRLRGLQHPGPPELCHFGSLASGALTSPANRIADFTMFKNWRVNALGEQGRVQFRRSSST